MADSSNILLPDGTEIGVDESIGPEGIAILQEIADDSDIVELEHEDKPPEDKPPEDKPPEDKPPEDKPSTWDNRSVGMNQNVNEEPFARILQPCPELGNWHIVRNLLTSEDLDRVDSITGSIQFSGGKIGAGTDGAYEEEVRKSKIGWIPQTEYTKWLYDKFLICARDLSEKHWGFNLYGSGERIQYTRYGPSGKYDWHMDSGNAGNSVNRKVTISVMISKLDECEGGEFQFHTKKKFESVDLDRGDAVIFPSYMMHRVLPIRSGLRESLVLWVSGPPFR